MQLPLNKLHSRFYLTAQFLNADARHYQLSFLAIFFCTGLLYLGWGLDLNKVLTTFTVCLIVQYLGAKITGKSLDSLKSAGISAFSLCLMFRSEFLWVIMVASIISIASKFLMKVNNKHVFNPTNFGICATIILTQQAWISPGQWGSKGIWWFVIGILGFIVLTKAKRLDTAIAFLLSFTGLMAYRILVFQDWPADFFGHLFTNGSLLLFTFFMITDPASTPSHRIARILWAVAIGALSFYLQAYQWINGAPVWALFFLSPLTPLLDYLFKGEKWNWNVNPLQKEHNPVIQ